MADSAIAARRRKDRERKTPGKWARTEAARASAGFFRARARKARCGVPLPSPGAATSTVLPPPKPSSLQEELNLQPLIPVALCPPPSSLKGGRRASQLHQCPVHQCPQPRYSLVAQGFVRRQPSAPARSPARRGAYTRHDYDTFASAGTSWCQRAISVHNATSLLRMPTEWRVERWLPFCIDML